MTDETPRHAGAVGRHEADLVADLVLDCRGMRCPLPVIELARRIGEIKVGESVAVVSDDPAAATDVPAWCRMQSQKYAGTEAHNDTATAYLVRRLR